jgi:N-acetyl sugar amidotransferase
MKEYQICTKCVMDTTDSLITFNSDGVCNHCIEYEKLVNSWQLPAYLKENKIQQVFSEIKKVQRKKKYDCIIGLSGGVDSSYIAYLASKHNLRPLCVHLDNGWNSELATHNIHNIVEKLNFDLYTHVIDWKEFSELQKAFFNADVIDIELLSDHAIFGVIIDLARKHGIKYILSGSNISTEAILPKSWVHRKQDLTNILDIYEKCGSSTKLKTFPKVSTLKHVFLMYALGYTVIKPLNFIQFNKDEAKNLLMKELDWRDYGGKHYESIFTKFYQAYILPEKFNVDKRRAHLSTLINSGQISREDALNELKKPLYEQKELVEDKDFVLKKLNFSEAWFDSYIKRPPKSHLSFKSDQRIYNILAKVKNRFFKTTI